MSKEIDFKELLFFGIDSVIQYQWWQDPIPPKANTNFPVSGFIFKLSVIGLQSNKISKSIF